MRMRIVFLSLMLTLSLSASAQRQWRLGDMVPDNVEIPSTLQGLGVWNDYAYLLWNRGQCMVVDLKHSRFVGVYQLDSCSGHCNNLSFSPNRGFLPEGWNGLSADTVSLLPLAFISNTFGDKACYVSFLMPNGSRFLGRIFFDSDCFPVAQDWCVDADRNELFAYGGRWGERLFLKRFVMPSLAPGQTEVHLTEADVLQTIPIDCVKRAQGSKIYRGYAFLPDGLEQGEFFLHVVNLHDGREVACLDLNDLGMEPEGVDVQGKWLYLSFTQNAKNDMIVRFKLRKVLAAKPH